MKTIGVVGCGLMGSGIAQVCAQSGYKTMIVEVSDELLKKGIDGIHRGVQKGIDKGKLTADQAKQIAANLQGTTKLEDVDECDLVVEAVIENVDEKKRIFTELDRITRPEALLATNTSSVCVIELAAVTERPDRVLGLHFFNPVPVMKLVEVVRTIATSDETIAQGREFVASLGKQPITCPDTTAFVVNKLLVPYLLDAVRMLEQGQVTREDIDKSMQLGCGYPMGPLTLLDFVGIDTTYYIANIMFDEFKNPRYAAPPLMKRMVLAGHLGKKVGRGFYDYSK
ncbi:MAG: 3-hydroxybutyryl-CoA dehydrogenase [Candidatus Krumholzibacteria bacterium]|nr:3-hydroxybutyryl-CoA dehydrogenase [Candidatus Krumholzibacteria bacterium]